MKQTNYGNWIPKTLMYCLWSASAVFLAAGLAGAFLWKNRMAAILSVILFLPSILMTVYMQICRRAFSFKGGNVMGKIHSHLLTRLPFKGNGTLLDIGCGSGALTIRCAKTYPGAQITGIDFWGREWNYAKEQCEQNARLEQAPPITFRQGDAASLPFEDASFDAAVSNFVFHEVKTQPDKRLVVRESLRVIKKGGSFAFHDLFGQSQLYGSMEEFVEQLKAEGISELSYEAHTENLPCIPWYTKAPWLLTGMGILYGIK
ncbi:class I SAM-dependent methyltransferase [Lachnospiraceae bacterium 54-53]